MSKNVKIELYLKYPPHTSILELEQLAVIWGIKVLASSPRRIKAEIIIESLTFQKMFGIQPKVGPFSTPSELKYFIDSINIMEITDV